MTSSGNNLVPIGSIIAWALEINPDDSYLECNGQVVDDKKYPKLYQLMHSTPDYRGVFLRGLGGNSASLGELQRDAIRNIYGSLPVNDNGSFPSPTGAFYYSYSFEYGPEDRHGSYNGVYSFDASRVVPVANENRPVNKAVRYFIKAK